MLYEVFVIGISIHAPNERSDLWGCLTAATPYQFQSTLLMKGATLMTTTKISTHPYFNPRS